MVQVQLMYTIIMQIFNILMILHDMHDIKKITCQIYTHNENYR